MKVLSKIDTKATEMCFVQYMPVALPYDDFMYIPQNLKWTEDIIYEASSNAEDRELVESFSNYIYLTVKHLWVDDSNPGNRKGWHIDGYMSDDQNYIWCDRNPTEYIPSLDSYEFSKDHEKSMEEMDRIAKLGTVHEIPLKTVVNMERTVHRVKEDILPGMRTFVKVTFSKHKYNLEGNARNPLLDLNWKMYPRKESRNHPYVLEE